MDGIGRQGGVSRETAPRRRGRGPLNDPLNPQAAAVCRSSHKHSTSLSLAGAMPALKPPPPPRVSGRRRRWSRTSFRPLAKFVQPGHWRVGQGASGPEVDALDGVMGRAADRGGIQFRMLNRSKGPAVRGPRTQADRKLYREAVQSILGEYPNLTLIEDGVEDLIVENDRVAGVVGRSGRAWKAGAVVVMGTFLKGLIYIGEKRISRRGGSANSRRSDCPIGCMGWACAWGGSRRARRRGFGPQASTGMGWRCRRRTPSRSHSPS